MRKSNEKVTIVSGHELRTGDKFKLINGDIVWTVIDADPFQYSNSVRAKGLRITAPFTKEQVYELVNSETK